MHYAPVFTASTSNNDASLMHQVNDVIDAPVVPSVTMETDGLLLHVLNLNSTSVGYISHKMFQCSQGPSVLYGFKAVISP